MIDGQIIKAIRRFFDGVKATAKIEAMRERLRGAEVIDGYGLAVYPYDGLVDAIVAKHGESHLVLAWHDKQRPNDLQPGEVCLYANTQAGFTRITCKKDGSIELAPANGKTKIVGELDVTDKITSPDITASTTLKVAAITVETHTHPPHCNAPPV